MATTFLSYSRRDSEFARRLEAALHAAGEETWVDWTGIPPTAEFAREIEKAIEGSDNFLLVMSPDSLAETSYCLKEIDHAAAMGKRMIPIYFRDVPRAAVPESLAKLNWIFFRETDDFDGALAKLLFALHTDLAWTSMSSRLLVRAVEWDKQGRDGSFLLRGKDLAEAEAWLAQAASKEGKPTELQSDYIHESRKAAIRTQRRVRNALVGGLALVLIGAGVAVYEAIAAKRQAAVATSRSLATAALLTKDQDFSLGLLLSVEAQKVADTYDSRNAIVTLWQAWPHLVRFERQKKRDDDPFLVEGSHGSLAVVWSGRPGATRRSLVRTGDWSVVHGPLEGAVDGGAFEISGDGSLLVESGGAGGIQVWTLADFAPHRMVSQPELIESGESRAVATFDPAEPGVLAVIDTRGRFGYQDPEGGESRNDVDPGRVALINSLLPVLPPRPPADRYDAHRTKAAEDEAMRRELLYEKAQVQRMAFRPGGDELAFSQGFDVSVVDLKAGKVVTHLNASAVPRYSESRDAVTFLSFSPDGRFLCARDGDGQLGVWTVQDAAGMDRNGRFVAQDDIVRGYDHYASASWLADGSLRVGDVLWRPGDARGTRLMGPVPGPNGSNFSMQFPAFVDATTVVTTHRGGVTQWHLQSGTVDDRSVAWIGEGNGSPADFSATQGRVAFSLADGFSAISYASGPLSDEERAKLSVQHLRRWDVLHGRELPEFTDPSIGHIGQPVGVRSGTVSGQGDVAVSLYQPGSNPDPTGSAASFALLWRTGRPDHAERIPLVSGETLLSLAFRPDGKVLAGLVVKGLGAKEGMLRLWSAETLREIVSATVDIEDAEANITFSSDGTQMFVSPWIYDAQTLRKVKALRDKLSIISVNSPVAFAPGNRQLAVDDDHMVALWDVDAGRFLGGEIDAGGHTIARGGDDTQGESFSADGRWMAIAYKGGRLALWRNPLVGWPELACSVANRNLTAEEWELYFGAQKYRKTCPGLADGRDAAAK